MNLAITIRNQCLVAVVVLALRESGVDCLLGSTRAFNTISVLHRAGFGHFHAQTLGGSSAQRQAYPHASTMVTTVEVSSVEHTRKCRRLMAKEQRSGVSRAGTSWLLVGRSLQSIFIFLKQAMLRCIRP